jgi:hypothetical protein
MGLAYGVMAGTVWVGVIYLVKGKNVGTIIGITSSATSSASFASPLIMGLLKDNYPEVDHGYYWVTRYSSIMAFLSFIVSIVVYY